MAVTAIMLFCVVSTIFGGGVVVVVDVLFMMMDVFACGVVSSLLESIVLLIRIVFDVAMATSGSFFFESTMISGLLVVVRFVVLF